MVNMPSCRLAACLCLAGVCLLPGHPGVLAAESLPQRLPRDTCLAFWTEDFAKTSAAFKKTNLGGLFSGDELSPLTAELRKRDQATLLHMRPWFGFDWNDLSKAKGPVALAVFPHTSGKFGAACVLDAAAAPEAKAHCLAEGERYFLAKKFKKSVVKLATAELVIYEPPPTRKNDLARVHFSSSTLFGAATSRGAAEALLALKEADSLAHSAEFKKLAPADAASPPPAAAPRIYVKPFELWKLTRTGSVKGGKPSARDPFVMAQRQGIAGLEAVLGLIVFPKDDLCDAELSLQVTLKSPLQKAMGLASLKPGPGVALPEWVAADSASVMTWQWDFATATKALGDLFDEMNEPGPNGEGLFDDLLSGLLEDPEGPKVDLRRDVFHRLGPQVLSISDKQAKPSAQNPRGERLLWLAACREAPKVADTLKAFYAGEKLVSYEKSGEVHTWTAPPGKSLFIEAEDQSFLQLRAVAVTPGELLFSTDVDLLKSALAIKPPGRALFTDADWLSLQKWQPSGEKHDFAAQAFFRPAELLASSYRDLRAGKPRTKDSYLDSLLLYFLLGTFDPDPQLPYVSLPEFDTLRPKLRPLSLRLSLIDTGWHVSGGVLGK